MSKPSMQAELPKVDRVWLCVSNVCERGKFKVSLEINSEHLMDLFYSYPDQNDGVVSQATNLTWMLKSSTAYDALLGELNILKSQKELETLTNTKDIFRGVGLIPIVEKLEKQNAELLAQCEAMAEAIEFSLKYDSRETEDGFFETDWMILQKALTVYEKFKEQK